MLILPAYTLSIKKKTSFGVVLSPGVLLALHTKGAGNICVMSCDLKEVC